MAKEQARAKFGNRQITAKEADDVEGMSSQRTPVIYEIVRKLGDEEMDRPITSLWWSGRCRAFNRLFTFWLKVFCGLTFQKRLGRLSSAALAIA